MARAHLYRVLTDSEGNVVPDVTVRVYEPGTTTPILQTMYVSDSGPQAVSNPFVAPQGVVAFYLDKPQRVRLSVLRTGASDPQVYDGVDVLLPFDPSGLETISLADISLEPASTASFVWSEVPVFRRGMIWRFKMTSTASTWGFRVSSQPAGAGELMFEAVGINSAVYQCSWPWMFENQDDPQTDTMYIGVSNGGSTAATWTITELRGEVHAR